MIKNLDYTLFKGSKSDIYLECGLKIKQYNIDEIHSLDNIGYSRYENIIWSLTRYPYEFKFDLEEIDIDCSTLTSYDIFLMLVNQRDRAMVLADLNFLFDDDFYLKDGFLQSDKGRIDSSTMLEIKQILEKIMFFKKPKERRPANEDAKKMIKLQIKKNKDKKVEYDIYSIMYSLVNNPYSSETYDTLLLRTPHQIYASYLHIQKEKDFDNTMSGLYAGIIKSADIDYNKINWINKIN